ncbi:MAG: hypothetical protein PW792_16285 [Acidobacteriaceae bacterium]|nr:hypothetical protein [Acidobacteriaceae bacterium]
MNRAKKLATPSRAALFVVPAQPEQAAEQGATRPFLPTQLLPAQLRRHRGLLLVGEDHQPATQVLAGNKNGSHSMQQAVRIVQQVEQEIAERADRERKIRQMPSSASPASSRAHGNLWQRILARVFPARTA